MTDTQRLNSPEVVATVFVETVVQESSSEADSSDESRTTRTQAESRQTLTLSNGQTLRIGRSRTNDFVIAKKSVSRFHAVLSASSSGIILSDLSSLNGTFLNGARISTPVNVSSGDKVTIADTRFTIQLNLGESVGEESYWKNTEASEMAVVVVTILLVDICGYTKLSEALPGKDVAEMMDRWIQQVSEIVSGCGGEVDKYIGDCVMALWRGERDEASSKANQALEAGREIMAETRRLGSGEYWKHAEEYPWVCRVAVNTGEAVMGTIGGAGKRDFTVLGDAVNVAFRLEGVAGDLGVQFILGSSTAQLVGQEFPLRKVGDVEVHGRSQTVEVWTLEERSAQGE